MKKIIILLLFFISNNVFSHSGEHNDTTHDHVTITQFCEQYHQRSYFILRLEEIITSIKKRDTKPFTFKFNSAQFNSARIIQCIKDIEATNALDPFYALWNETRRYKYLDDQAYALEVTKLLFTIQHTIYTQSKPTRDAPSFDLEFHLSCSSYTEATTIRKYYSRRLFETFELLKKIRCSKRSLFEVEHDGCDCSFITHHTFENKAINDCIKAMEKAKSLKPFLRLYKEFVTYKLIQDELFLKEFTALAFIISQNIFINNIQDPPTSTQKRHRDQVAHINQNLDKIPIEEILEAIDLLNKELPPLLEKYEFTSNMTWKEWLKKYWWLPPTVVFILAKHFQGALTEHFVRHTLLGVIRHLIENPRDTPPSPTPPADRGGSLGARGAPGAAARERFTRGPGGLPLGRSPRSTTNPRA